MRELEDATLDCIRNAARILMGAAFIDGNIEGIEEDTIIDLLSRAVGDEDDLPEDLQDVLDDFEPDDFDLENVAEELLDEPDEHRYHILLMVSRLRAVSEQDDDDDDDEDDAETVEGSYQQRVAAALEVELDILDGESPQFDEDDEEA